MRTLLSPEDWARLQEIFDAAVDLPAVARATFLDEKCADAPDLRLRINSLLTSLEADTRVGG